ncbi:lipid droplet-associated hydrolase isoform X2 [Aplysia californica]|uniref:Lipid droplet-associated hydrolase n=1 Tax=Aplysia californica TaxID=6500 RepID=A0ABM0JHE8_APLCA|nr:lipid droplet-associated hydrolase isoform X2 [Aplysia californica]
MVFMLSKSTLKVFPFCTVTHSYHRLRWASFIACALQVRQTLPTCRSRSVSTFRTAVSALGRDFLVQQRKASIFKCYFVKADFCGISKHSTRKVMATSNGKRAAEEIEEKFVKVGEVETSLLTLGHFRDASSSEDAKRVLFLIIPGNPGVPTYYEDFMQELYSHCEGQIPVWTVGQAGHVQPPDQSLSFSDVFSTRDDIYSLKAQIEHKVTFIRENIPPDVSLILIGHSIGCYMILNMLEHLPSSQVLRCFMLFPTVERMATSPQGQAMTPVLRYLRWFLVAAALFVVMIPMSIRRPLIEWHFRRADCPPCLYDGVVRTLTPWTANFASYLAKVEMNEVTELQEHLIKKHLKKLSFYYGTRDHWAPVQYFYDLKTTFPDVDARLCSLNLKHAFVLETPEGKAMAKIVWLWAQSHHHTVLSHTGSVDQETWAFDG